MGRWPRSRRDDVDVESFLANLDRVPDVAILPMRRILDLRPADDIDEVDEIVVLEASEAQRERTGTAPRLTSGRGAAASSGRTRPG